MDIQKSNECVKTSQYDLILHHPQVVQLEIANYFFKVSIYDHSEKRMVPKHFLKVSVRELHNSTVSPPEEGGLKEANPVKISHFFLQVLNL